MTGLLHSTPRSIALLLAGCAMLVWALVPVVTGNGAPEAQAQANFVCELTFAVDAPREIDASPGDQFSYSFLASISVFEVTSINLAVSPGSAAGLIVSSSPAQTSIQVQDPPARTTYEVPGTISIGVPFEASGGSYLVSGINATAVCQVVGGSSTTASAAGSSIQVNVIEPTPTPTATDTPTPTSTATDTPTPTATNTASPTPTASATATSTATTPPSPTPTSTSTATATSPPNATNTPTATAAGTASSTSPNAPTPTPSSTASQPATSTATSTPTAPDPGTQPLASTGTPTATGTVTSTPAGTVTATPSASGTATGTTGSPTATITGTRADASATSDDADTTEDVDDAGIPEGTSTPEGEVESAASSLVLDFTEERAVVLVEDDEDRSWFQIGAGLLGLALIAGGGYGIWRGRERGL